MDRVPVVPTLLGVGGAEFTVDLCLGVLCCNIAKWIRLWICQSFNFNGKLESHEFEDAGGIGVGTLAISHSSAVGTLLVLALAHI